MIKFIDIENGNVFNGNQPYVFWLDDQQSVNRFYIKKICVLSDVETINLSMEDNSVYRFINMQNLDQYADVDINDFTYKDIQDLQTTEYDSTGVGYDNYYIHMVYIAAQSDATGEIHEYFRIGQSLPDHYEDGMFEVAGDFYADNEALPINLSNLGVELPEPIQGAIYDENVHEENKDSILLNRKYKELLLQYWDTIANRGSYKSLLNSLDWFEYGDAVTLQEIWKHKEWGLDRYNREELNTIMTDKIRQTLSNFAKTTYLGIYAALQKFIKGEDGVVEYDKLVDSSDDSEDYGDYEGLIGEVTPKLQSKFFKWSVEEMSLKMYLLGSFYESYFMPIHLDLLHSTIESIVFTNTIKTLNDTHLDRSDFMYDTQTIHCNVKDGDTFVMRDVEVQAGATLKRHYDDSEDSEDYETEMVETYEESKVDGPEIVDLGLSVKWAKYNVGALNEHDYGDYYAWGEIDSNKQVYSWDTYKFGPKTELTKYNETDGKTILEPEDDVVHCIYGYPYRMPTATELAELRDRNRINSEWVTINGVPGRRYTSIVPGYEGNSIFIPAAGFRSDGGVIQRDSYGYIWSSDINLASLNGARDIHFNSGGTEMGTSSRSWGFSIRPVCDKQTEPSNLPYVTFKALQDDSSIGLQVISSNQTLEYSTDLTIWSALTSEVTVTLNKNEECYVRGILSGDNTADDFTRFKMTGRIEASGNCNALWDHTNLDAPLKEYCGCGMFEYCTSLITPPELPSTTLSADCYNSMFDQCSNLVKAPSLPATTLADACYYNMFYKCTSLEKMPTLPATKLADFCYARMFGYCSSLYKTSNLPATKMKPSCYRLMFSRCTSLTKAPVLPATKLEQFCYNSMFQYCSNLKYIKCLALDVREANAANGWVNGVSQSGTFIKHKDATWTIGTSGIPEGWTVKDDINEYDEYPIFGIEDEYDHPMQYAGEDENDKVVNDCLKTFMINTYNRPGVVVPFHCEMSAESGDFINREMIYVTDEDGTRTLEKHRLYKEVDGKFILDFKLLLIHTGEQQVTLQFFTAGGRSYIHTLHLTVLGDTVCGLKVYKVKSSDMVCYNNVNGVSINSEDYSIDNIPGYDELFKSKYIRPYNDYFFSHTRYSHETDPEPLHTYQTFIACNTDKNGKGARLNHVIIFDAKFFDEADADKQDTVLNYIKDEPSAYRVNLFNVGKREIKEGDVVVKTYYILVSKFFVGSDSDVVIDMMRNALNGYIVRYSKGFFYQHHYLEEIGVGLNESTGQYEYGLSIDDYTITDKDTVCVVPSLSYSNIKLDETEWVFKNMSDIKKTEYKYPSIKEPFVGNTVKQVLPEGYYDIIFRYKIGDTWNEARLDSAFRKA